MTNYNSVLKYAKDLMEEFPKLSQFEALQIAGQIQVSDVLENGLQTGYSGQPAFLEAIAMILGYDGKIHGSTILSTLQNISANLPDSTN